MPKVRLVGQLVALVVLLLVAPAARAADTPALLAPADTIVGEKDGTVGLLVRLSSASPDPVSVNYATANSTAGAGTACFFDYVAAAGTLTFAPGETSKTVTVTIGDCADAENLESFTFGLNSAVNAPIARAAARVSIVDDDTVVATPRLLIRDAIVDEQAGVALVPVLLGGPRGQSSASTVTVDYATADGTATGGDYTAQTGTLTFNPGRSVRTIAIPIADDASAEPAETFTVRLSGAANATIANGTGTVTIGASDATPAAQPSISAPRDAIVGEGDGYVDVAVRLSAPGTQPVAVDYATANSTAGAGAACFFDYVAAGGTLNFAPGETTKVVRVELGDCADAEALSRSRST